MEIDFHNPDYEAIIKYRIDKLKRLRENPQLLPALKEYYKEHPVEFICDWGMTEDPRNAEIGKPVVIPFVLFDKQKEYINWLYERWKNRESGLCEKSRDSGVTWLCVWFAIWMWIFYKDSVVGFGSRKEEYVDKIGDPKSIFHKLRKAIDLLPKEFRPKFEAPFMRVINQENGASIVGEAGDNIGRGNRTSVYFKDESAFYERADAIDAALSQTSNCRIDVSTPNGNGNAFYRKRHSGKVPVFTFHWTDDPRKDRKWYEKQCAELDPLIVAQEIDIDYNASVANSFIDGSLVEEAQSNYITQVEAVGLWIIGVDAAHMGDDESIIHFRKGRLNLEQKTFRKLDGIQLAYNVEAECDKLGSSFIGGIVIELDGPGVSCYDQLKSGKYGSIVKGVHTGARLRDGKHFNIRAKLWDSAKEYLQDQPCVIFRDNEFKSQISAMKYRYRDGLLLMQDKQEYKKDFGHSPDRADAFVLTFDEIPNRYYTENTTFATDYDPLNY